MATDLLEKRFAALVHPPDDSDWLDVVRHGKLDRSRSRSRRPALAVAAAAVAVLAAVLATPSFGLGEKLVRLFSSGEPAPVMVGRSFAHLDAGAPPALATGAIGAEARKMVLSSGIAIWLAPTKAGGFCYYLANGGGQCDAERVLSFWPLFSLGGSYTKDGVITGDPVTVAGSTTLPDARTVEIRFEDGAVADVPVVWISAPIDAGFFAYQVPQEHWAKGHRPVEAVLRDGDGKELASDSSAFHVPVFRRGAATGLAPCIARAGGATCLAGAIGSGRGLKRTLDASRKGNESGGSDR